MRQVMYSDGTPSREIEDDDDGRPHALDLLGEQKKRIAELEAEVEALKHDLARAIRRNTELLNPNT